MVPISVEGEQGTVVIGIQPTGLPIHLFDGAVGAFRLRAALNSALTGLIDVTYPKGLVEPAKIIDVITDTVVAHARNTM